MTIVELKQRQCCPHTCCPHTELVMEIQRLMDRLHSAEDALKQISDEDIDNLAGQSASIADGYFMKYEPKTEDKGCKDGNHTCAILSGSDYQMYATSYSCEIPKK